jgi:hypothetical protein
MLDPTRAPETEPDRRRRRLTNVFIAAFLAFQVAVPLRYYLGDRDYDERFSWRMFSTLRLRDCDVRVSETVLDGNVSREQPVAIERDVQVAWVRLLERMRRTVVDKYLRRRCEREHVERVEYVLTCKDTDGQDLPALGRVLRCAEAQPQQTEEVAP